MDTKKAINRTLTRNLIISSIVWASVILFHAFSTSNSKKEMTMLLLSAFYIEFLRITSYNKSVQKEANQSRNEK